VFVIEALKLGAGAMFNIFSFFVGRSNLSSKPGRMTEYGQHPIVRFRQSHKLKSENDRDEVLPQRTQAHR
jgi:hypothetical protein